jgi:hypothetical protein
MYPRLFLSVWVLDQVDFSIGPDAIDLVDGYEVVDPLALVLEMEARVLEGCRQLDNRLSDFVDLLMRRDLFDRSSALQNTIFL